MLPTLFAVRSSWLAVLVVLVVVGLVWFAVRVVVDLIAWFREDTIDDYRRRMKKAAKAQQAESKTDDSQTTP